MKKQISAIIFTSILISLSFMALLTNPSKDDFSIWVKDQYMSQVKLEESGLAEVMMFIAGPQIVNNMTTSHDYVLFSTFDISINDTDKIIVLGAFNNFITLSGSQYLKSLS